MGLAAAHGIVESHAGKILMSSTPGAGACFHVLLPIVEDQRAEP